MILKRIIDLEAGAEMGTYAADTDEEALRLMAEAHGWAGAKFAAMPEGQDGRYIVLDEED